MRCLCFPELETTPGIIALFLSAEQRVCQHCHEVMGVASYGIIVSLVSTSCSRLCYC